MDFFLTTRNDQGFYSQKAKEDFLLKCLNRKLFVTSYGLMVTKPDIMLFYFKETVFVNANRMRNIL